VYRIKIKDRKKRTVLYFDSWDSACSFCVLVGIRIKAVKAA